MSDPFETYDVLCDSYIRYIQTNLGFNSEELEKERDLLLRESGLLFQNPRFEPIFPPPSSEKTLSQFYKDLGMTPQVSNFLAQGGNHGLAPIDRRLYKHQANAIKASVVEEKDVVVTTGTGSGKTECFLLPIFSYLIKESRNWTGHGDRNPDHPWWRSRQRLMGQRVSQRYGENRPVAIRALVLYPLNALVEDQLMRLRRSCDSPEARQWLRAHRGDNRFYFGRYTGLTPVPGQEKLENSLRRLREQLEKLRRQAEKVIDSEEMRYFFPSTDVDTAEMWSRWDMQEHPPDILITNYSMLNIMLIRELEQPMFEKTKEWLASDGSVFHLVVDELHSYRGTAGSEVAYLLRTLFNRLGLDPDSPKLRIIASSASLQDDEGQGDEAHQYLRQFFARRREFAIIRSEPQPDQSSKLQECLKHAVQFEAFDQDRDSTQLDKILSELDIKSAIAQLCYHKGKLRASTIEEMVANANEISSTPVTKAVIRGLIRYLTKQKDPTTNQALLPIRIHYFFKNLEGLWACSNPNCCREINVAPIGKLFAHRRVLCDECGSRVLELLICQTCGDLFLGGYKQPISATSQGWYLNGDYQELEGLPEKGIRDRNYEAYAIFWPRSEHSPDRQNWTNNQIERRWAPGRFSPSDGTLIPDSLAYNGYYYRIDNPEEFCSEIPKYCPNCGDAWDFSRKSVLVNSKEQMYSPIHHMGTGLQAVIQILTQALQATVNAQSKRKTIIFSDSRQDAAKYAVGIQWSHYQDMIRLIAIDTMKKQAADQDLLIIRDFESPRSEFRNAIRRLKRKYPSEQGLLDSIVDAYWDGNSLTSNQENQLAKLETNYPFTALQKACFDEFIQLGMNPGGYGDQVEFARETVRNNREIAHKWQEICRWDESSVELRDSQELEPHQDELLNRIQFELKRAIAERILFARRDMGLEGLGLARCEPTTDSDKWTIQGASSTEIMAAVTRILGERRYTQTCRPYSPQKSMPKFLEDYLEKSAEKMGCLLEDLTEAVGEQIDSSNSFENYLIRIENLNLCHPQVDTIFRCSKCSRKHLYKAGGICTNTKCLGELEEINRKEDTMERYGGYYAYQADSATFAIQPYRFHCEELTAQTDSEERPNRQRWFQGVILDDENQRTDEIDLLSVTTTMEAGVDIGGLSMVLMGNVPPQRFNYQQRVGRAGRRGEPVSYALTLCRLRTHDDHYFSHTGELTNAETPPPYLDMRSQDIINRVLAKEVLYNAFRQSSSGTIAIEKNVHGEFGKVSDWEVNRETLVEWIANNRKKIEQIVQLLVTETELGGKKEELTEWALNKLVREIDSRFEAHPFEDDDLSQSLAESGLLPMFGFPTGVRPLYHQRPQIDNWPPTSGVVDRDIEIAISQFAPGSETVKDKKIHTSIGIVSYKPEGGQLVPDSGIAHAQAIGFCASCKAIFASYAESENICRICGSEEFKWIQGIEPKGFLTNYRPDDAHESFNWAPRSTYSRLPSDSPANLKNQLNFRWVSESKLKLFSVNTNSDRLFALRKQLESDALVSAEVCKELAGKNDSYSFDENRHLVGSTEMAALYAVKTTDVLLIEVDEIPIGLLAHQGNEVWRAALYSFGFLLRQFAASRLDISPNELRVEIRPVEEGENHKQQVFLADSLANGAGYCRHLGERDGQGRPFRLIRLLNDMIDPVQDFAKGLIAHANDCDSSCYTKGCMRDYSNMPYHPFLDWRLGLDVARLCLEKGYQMNLQGNYWASLVNRVEKNLIELFPDLKRHDLDGEPAFKAQNQNTSFMLHHPLADFNGPEFINIFDVIRRVSRVMNQVGPTLNRNAV